MVLVLSYVGRLTDAGWLLCELWLAERLREPGVEGGDPRLGFTLVTGCTHDVVWVSWLREGEEREREREREKEKERERKRERERERERERKRKREREKEKERERKREWIGYVFPLFAASNKKLDENANQQAIIDNSYLM